ncbi:MAG TPA: hypothetical protein VF796_30920 [Humisphaera sp.]
MPGKSWRVSELRHLTDAVRAARSPSEIAIPGRTPGAVRAMASRLNLIGDGISRKRWPDADVARLRRLVGAGWTAKRIAEAAALPGYGRNAIQKQMQRLSLGRPERSLPQKRASRLAGPLADRFMAFLAAHAAARTPTELSALWNAENRVPVTPQRVLYHLGRLGLRPRPQPDAVPTDAPVRRSTPPLGSPAPAKRPAVPAAAGTDYAALDPAVYTTADGSLARLNA